MLDAGTQALLDEYLKSVLEINRVINLTSVNDYSTARVLHLEDSLSALPELNKAPSGLMVDLGTGGGFPGVPLALATGRDTLLVDSREKKINAIMSILKQLDVKNISGYSGRIEQLAIDRRSSFSVATARALSSLPTLLELVSPLLIIGGFFIAYKSSDIEDELERANSIEDTLGMSLADTRSFLLSDDVTSRTLLLYVKQSEPSLDLPRRNGLAQKRPLA